MVLVNRRVEDGALPAVAPDDRAGAGLAVEHLAALGHRRIAHLGGPQHLSTGHQRHLGYLDALRAAGLEADRAAGSLQRRLHRGRGRTAPAGELLDAAPGITAIVAANDLLALGCYDVLEERGLSSPVDLSVVGFNDMPFADRFHPPLTTVRIPHREIGLAAGGLLLELLGEPEPEARTRQLLLAPSLVVRGSTGPPPA